MDFEFTSNDSYSTWRFYLDSGKCNVTLAGKITEELSIFERDNYLWFLSSSGSGIEHKFGDSIQNRYHEYLAEKELLK